LHAPVGVGELGPVVGVGCVVVVGGGGELGSVGVGELEKGVPPRAYRRHLIEVHYYKVHPKIVLCCFKKQEINIIKLIKQHYILD
ncbi:hypothetical protein AVEN_170846-1, partial [Araneus ventricosus]